MNFELVDAIAPESSDSGVFICIHCLLDILPPFCYSVSERCISITKAGYFWQRLID